MMLELSLEFIPSTNILSTYWMLSDCLCMRVNRSFLNGGKCMYMEQHNVFGELSGI